MSSPQGRKVELPMNDEKKRQRLAVAEAGKAVMSFMFGCRVDALSLAFPLSWEKARGKGPPFLPFRGDTERLRPLVERRILFTLSGSAAVHLLVDESAVPSLGDPDLQEALDAARPICGSEEECAAFVEWLWRRCLALLSLSPRPDRMRALAEYLLREGHMPGETVLRFFRR